jgi:hypothetical protein
MLSLAFSFSGGTVCLENSGAQAGGLGHKSRYATPFTMIGADPTRHEHGVAVSQAELTSENWPLVQARIVLWCNPGVDEEKSGRMEFAAMTRRN